MLHRLGIKHRKPPTVSRKLNPAKQAAFIEAYKGLLSWLDADQAALFADAAPPTHAFRPVGWLAPKETKVAMEQASTSQRLTMHGAIVLQTGRTRMLQAPTVDAASTIALLAAIEAAYPE